MEIRCNCHSGCGYGDNGDNSRILPPLPVAEPVDQLSTAPHSGAGCIIAPCAYPRTGSHLPTGNPRSRQSFPQHCPHAFPQSTSLIHQISQVIHNHAFTVPAVTHCARQEPGRCVIQMHAVGVDLFRNERGEADSTRLARLSRSCSLCSSRQPAPRHFLDLDRASRL